MESPIKIFTGSNSRYLADKIAKSYGITLGKSSVHRFSDGEFQPSYDETVRGNYVFIVQSTFMPTENLFELNHPAIGNKHIPHLHLELHCFPHK